MVNLFSYENYRLYLIDYFAERKKEQKSYSYNVFSKVTYKPDDANLFQLNKLTRALSIANMLDRENIDNHQIKIIASNSETIPNRGTTVEQELLVNILVNDVNDNPPTFNPKTYGGGISVNDNQNKVLFTLYVSYKNWISPFRNLFKIILKATDPDLDDVITFSLVEGSVKADGADISDVKDNMFKVDKTGEVRLNNPVKESMRGFFEFTVQANDLVNHTDTAEVKIFIVAETNRVTFVFINDASQFVENPFLQQTVK